MIYFFTLNHKAKIQKVYNGTASVLVMGFMKETTPVNTEKLSKLEKEGN